MAVGLAVGVAGAGVLLPLMRRVSLPSESLYPLRTLIVAGVIYGAASVLRLGFLAVFVAGLLLGDARAPFKVEIERFQSALASFAEITVFVALGLTIELGSLDENGVWLDGLLFALACLPRPAARGRRPARGDAAPSWRASLHRLERPERSRADPARVARAPGRRQRSRPDLRDRLRRRLLGPRPGIARARSGSAVRSPDPAASFDAVQRVDTGRARAPRPPAFHCRRARRAAGKTVRDLPISEGTWLTLVVHGSEAVRPRGSYVLHPKDEVLVLSDPADEPALRRLFEGGVDGG